MPATAERKHHNNRRPDGPLTAGQRNALLEAWLKRWPYPLAHIVARHPKMLRMAYHHGFDDDDLNAACLEAGANAARLYDPARGVKFTTFVVFHLRAGVERLIGREVRDHAKRGGPVVSLSTPVGNGTGDDDELSRLLPGPAPDAGAPADREELAAAVWAAVERVSQSAADRTTAELRWGLNGKAERPLREIARLLGVSKEAVRQREEKLKRKLREELEGVYLDHCQDAHR